MKKINIVITFALIVSLILNVFLFNSGKDEAITYIDTITYEKAVPVDSIVLRYETALFPLAAIPTGEVKQDTVTITDSVRVIVPIAQKIYETKDFKASVSGYHASLDSIRIFIQKQKPKRWGVGIQAGAGATGRGIQPYIGVGISYNLFSF